MKRLGSLFFWTLVFAVLLIAADQAMVRLPDTPGDFRRAYLELREDILERATTGKIAPTAAPRYVYVDAEGNLHFADALQEVPSRFRTDAKRLEH